MWHSADKSWTCAYCYRDGSFYANSACGFEGPKGNDTCVSEVSGVVWSVQEYKTTSQWYYTHIYKDGVSYPCLSHPTSHTCPWKTNTNTTFPLNGTFCGNILYNDNRSYFESKCPNLWSGLYNCEYFCDDSGFHPVYSYSCSTSVSYY